MKWFTTVVAGGIQWKSVLYLTREPVRQLLIPTFPDDVRLESSLEFRGGEDTVWKGEAQGRNTPLNDNI